MDWFSHSSNFGKCFRSLGKRFLADVGIAVTHGGALVAHQRHHNRIGDAGVLEQGNGRVTQRVEAQSSASGALAGPTDAPRERCGARGRNPCRDKQCRQTDYSTFRLFQTAARRSRKREDVTRRAGVISSDCKQMLAQEARQSGSGVVCRVLRVFKPNFIAGRDRLAATLARRDRQGADRYRGQA